MLEEVIVAGSGGQGVLMLGEVLAIGTIFMGNKATWLPSYGPEMRGGTANCSVVLSSEEIGSPMIEHATAIVCFNQPSILKFAPQIAPNGIIVANDDAIEEYPKVDRAEIVKIKANTLAISLGNERTINMIMLGALLKKCNLIRIDSAKQALEHIWGPEKAQKLIPLNMKAIQCGYDAV